MSKFFLCALLMTALLAPAGPAAAVSGPYSGATQGVTYNDPRFVGWATGINVTWPAGFTPFYNDPAKALGAAPGSSNDVVTLGNTGSAVVTFGRAVSNGPGPDLAVFENGFNNPIYPGQLFGELAFVEVSSDGASYARFPSVSLNAWPGEYGSLEPTNIHNLAGKHVNNNDQAWQGTPFDLSDLAAQPLVLSGSVDLNDVRTVRIVDIYGHSDGTTLDDATSLVDPLTGQKYATNHVIFDGGNYGLQLTGFDLDAVGILEALVGDANGDGKVDGGDLAIWQQHYDPLGALSSTGGPEIGDFNRDGKVDGGDLALWQQHYDPLGIAALGATTLSFEETKMGAVPEPGSLAMIVLGLPTLAASVLRRRK